MAFERAGPIGLAPIKLDWIPLMDLALFEAKDAAKQGDVPVGAVLIDKSGDILAKAANRVERDRDPAGHAEIIALRLAAAKIGTPRLTGCLLIVTLEPCLMCAAAIALSRIDGVIFGAADLRAGALISAADACNLPLGGHTFWHLGGIKSGECAKLLQDFFSGKRN